MPLKIEIPEKIAPGTIISLSRRIRAGNGKIFAESLEKNGNDLLVLLKELDRRGFDADLIIRRKRGRPSHLSIFLSNQCDLFAGNRIDGESNVEHNK